MTIQTDTKSTGKLISLILSENGIDNLKLEMDLTQAFMSYWHEREGGKTPAQARDKVMEILRLNEIGSERDAMRRRVEAAMGRNPAWDDLKYDWNGFDSWLIEKEQTTGETIEQFMQWHNGDVFRMNGVIYLTAYKIKDWWGMAFKRKTDEVKAEYTAEELEKIKNIDWSKF